LGLDQKTEKKIKSFFFRKKIMRKEADEDTEPDEASASVTLHVLLVNPKLHGYGAGAPDKQRARFSFVLRTHDEIDVCILQECSKYVKTVVGARAEHLIVNYNPKTTEASVMLLKWTPLEPKIKFNSVLELVKHSFNPIQHADWIQIAERIDSRLSVVFATKQGVDCCFVSFHNYYRRSGKGRKERLKILVFFIWTLRFLWKRFGMAVVAGVDANVENLDWKELSDTLDKYGVSYDGLEQWMEDIEMIFTYGCEFTKERKEPDVTVVDLKRHKVHNEHLQHPFSICEILVKRKETTTLKRTE
jgi:hypothetical protein